MAHKTAVHRWDAESAGPAGLDATPLDQALAADGIDEFFEVFTSLRLGADAIEALGPVTLRLVATDAERSWLVRADGTAALVDLAGRWDACCRPGARGTGRHAAAAPLGTARRRCVPNLGRPRRGSTLAGHDRLLTSTGACFPRANPRG